MAGVGLAAAALAVGGCVGTSEQDKEMLARSRAEAGLRPDPVRMSRAEAEAFFSNRTRVSTAYNLGSQVSYLAPDGNAYLWFPGNLVVLPGRWHLKETGGYAPYAGRPVSRTSICFSYGANTVNAWTRAHERETCAPVEISKGMLQDSAEGDVFDLSRRERAPFVLPPRPTTIAEIANRLKSQ